MNIASVLGRIFWLIVPCCLLAGVAIADSDSAADSDSDAAADGYLQLENCIPTNRIRRTAIVDDRTIIFYMNQQKIYVNQLPYRCAGLRSAGTFSYRPRVMQLCNVDTITVVRSTGSRLDSGPTCGLGKFRPVTEEEAAMIRNKEAESPPLESGSADDANVGQAGVNDSGSGNPD